VFYITLRSMGKMHRHFQSPEFRIPLRQLPSMIMVDVQATQFPDLEQHVFSSILSLPEFSGQFPSLNEAITKFPKYCLPYYDVIGVPSASTCILELAQKKASTLYEASIAESTPFDEFSKQLTHAYNMNFVNIPVHSSPFAHLHIQLLEFPAEGKLDNDATLELQRKHRQFRETLYLMVMFRGSLDVVTSTKFGLLRGLGMEGAGRKKDLHDWRDVVKSIFPAETVTPTSTLYCRLRRIVKMSL